MNDMHYAQFLANELYGVDIPTTKFEELALLAHNFIGNKQSEIKQFIGMVDPETKMIELPCDVWEIESVTADPEDWEHVTNKDWNGDLKTLWTEQYIESRKNSTKEQYQSGSFVDYTRIDDCLYFKNFCGPVKILYRTELLGEDGLPKISDKEAIAIAAYVAYVTKQKEAFLGNPQAFLLALVAKADWAVKCDAARTPEYLSQNDMDNILEARNTPLQKRRGKSFKPIV